MKGKSFCDNNKTVLSVKQSFSLCILSVNTWISWTEFPFYLKEFILLNMIKKGKKSHNKKARERQVPFVLFPQD